jgi:hypothetical protein
MKLKTSPRRKRQMTGILVGITLLAVTFAIIMWPGNEQLTSLGPMNIGHETLKCNACHVKAKGNVFQQFGANTQHIFGMRKKPVTFGHEDVSNNTCKSCHQRPDDRHPVHRFMEPRFAEVRNQIHPEKCESCHREHNSVRLVIDDTGYCQNCHKDTELKKDPLMDVSHSVLISQNKWSTCLQCHDFHGNHIMETPVAMKDTIPLRLIKAYILGGISPYSAKKKHKAKKLPS